MTANWTHIGPIMAAAFLASLVEAVEALTIVLAVATVRGWRPAGLGAIAGLSSLALIVMALGPLLDRVPLHLMQLAIGVLLLPFGMRWLRKAILRAAADIPLHDEASVFAAETAELRGQAGSPVAGSRSYYPMYSTRLCAFNSAGVVGCAGSCKIVACWPSHN